MGKTDYYCPVSSSVFIKFDGLSRLLTHTSRKNLHRTGTSCLAMILTEITCVTSPLLAILDLQRMFGTLDW